MVVAFYFRLHLAYFPRPVVAIFARPEQHCSFPCSLRYQCVGSSIMNGATALLFIRFLEFQGKSI